MYKCCIFDLDGTLINTVYALSRTMNLTLEHFGLPPIEDEDTKQYVGDGYRNFVNRSFRHWGEARPDVLKEAYGIYNWFFRENCLYRIEAYEGMKDLLAYLKGQNIMIAVVTNKGQERAEENIDMVFGEGYFDMILGEQDGINRKPDPAGALYTAKSLGVKPGECLYLGDTNTDMKTGQAAGMDTVGVTWGFRGRAELEAFSPKYIVDDPREVIKIVA